MSKTKQAKARVVFDWLQSTFPTRRPCELVFMRTGSEGRDTFEGYVIEYTNPSRIEVIIDERLRSYTMVSTLIHEYAHLKSRRGDRHGPVFREMEERIDRAFWKWRAARDKASARHHRSGSGTGR